MFVFYLQVILDVDVGLLIGVVLSIFLVLLQSMNSSVDITSGIKVDKLTFWRKRSQYYTNVEPSCLKIVRINFPLYFVNAEIVQNAIFKKTGFNPLKITSKEKKIEVTQPENKDVKEISIVSSGGGDADSKINTAYMADAEKGQNSLSNGATVNGRTLSVPQQKLSALILDMTLVASTDLMGVKTLEFLLTKYNKAGVEMYLVNISENCLDTLQKSGFMKKHESCVFLTVESVLEHLAAGNDSNSIEGTRL